MTRYGFFSVVALPGGGGVVMVRARDRTHLEALQARAQSNHEILDQPRSDYRWRILMPAPAWADLLRELAEEVEWSNFKDEADRYGVLDGAWLGALHRVWGLLYRLQAPAPLADLWRPW